MTIWIRLAQKAETRGKRFAVTAAVLVTFFVLMSDWATGPLPWTGFYLFPLALLSWVVGLPAGLLFAAVVPVITYEGFFLIYSPAHLGWLTPMWIPMRVATFALFALLFSALHDTLVREQRHVARLRQINADLERFAAAASHDLQAPLTRILSFLDLIRTSGRCPIDSREELYLERASASAIRLRQLVQDLLIFARLGRGERNFVLTDLNQVADRVLEDLSERIAETGATVRRTELPAVVVVSSDFYQLLLNLVGNAIHYRRPDVAPVVTVSGGASDGTAWIEVSDNGRGIPEEDRKRIFEPFERGSTATNGGTGIGLAICRRAVETHGGHLTVRSRVNDGTVFRAEFPMFPITRRPAPEKTPAASAA